MGRKKMGVIIGVIAAAAVSAAGIWYFLGGNGKDSNDRVYVERVASLMGNISGALNRYSGVVQPQETVEVNADSERTISEVLVEVGDAVEEGTPLFNYDTEDLKLELEQAKLELENQDIEISNFRTQISDLEKERQAAAEGDKFEYTTQIQTIQTQIKQAEFQKSSKELEMSKLQKRVDNSQVVSNAEGVIKSINDGKSPNEESSAFITILSTGEYRIKGTANEQNIGMISPGEEVIIRSRVDETITWNGMIESMDTDETEEDSLDNMGYDNGEEDMSSSSSYSFYVSIEDASDLMLGQHVLLELDQGQTEVKEGIWLTSGYIVFENAEDGAPQGTESLSGILPEETEMLYDLESGTESAYDMENGGVMSYDYDGAVEMTYYDGYDMESTEALDPQDSTEMMQGQQGAFVWADNGNGRLEKRYVTLGMYDMELDQYEILSGLSEDDLIAWPMEGLYEGVRTVTDMEEVDYSSGLYNQGTEEDMLYDPEMEDMYPGAEMDDGWNEGGFDTEYYDGDGYEDGYYDEDEYGDDYYDDEGYDEEEYDEEGYEDEEESAGGVIHNKKDKISLEEFLDAGGRR